MACIVCDLQLMKNATASQLLSNSSPAEHLRLALQQVICILNSVLTCPVIGGCLSLGMEEFNCVRSIFDC